MTHWTMQSQPLKTVEVGQPPTTTNLGLSPPLGNFLFGPFWFSLGDSLTFLGLLSILLAGSGAGVIPFGFV